MRFVQKFANNQQKEGPCLLFFMNLQKYINFGSTGEEKKNGRTGFQLNIILRVLKADWCYGGHRNKNQYGTIFANVFQVIKAKNNEYYLRAEERGLRK